MAFQDLCYKLDEAALLAFAVHPNGLVLDILGFGGKALSATRPAVQILAKLVGFFQDEIQYALERGEDLKEVILPQGEELSIPEGLAGLRDRQLNDLIANTRFSLRMPNRYNVDLSHEHGHLMLQVPQRTGHGLSLCRQGERQDRGSPPLWHRPRRPEGTCLISQWPAAAS